ncbi:MAG TPA: hypothetical protein VK171_14160 [Fimbriimonas sp.]|nr:hypothetical protein [Fimbriimonas sp.]
MREFKNSFAGPATVKSKYGLRVLEELGVLLAIFEVEQKPFINEKIKPSTFYEGLWRYDCGEVWLYAPSTGRYLEVNIAPNGAWWACVFSGVRVRDTNCVPPLCEPSSVETDHSWYVNIKLELADIERCLGSLDNLQANVTLVLGGCPDVDAPPENLHTIVPLSKMDFHQPEQWQPIEILITDAGSNAV